MARARWALLLVLAAGCSDIVTPTLDVTADQTTLAPGERAQLTVIRHFQGGPFDNVTSQVVYGVDKKSLINITPAGIVTPASDTGIATVTVTDKDDTAFAIIRFTVTAGSAIDAGSSDAGVDSGL